MTTRTAKEVIYYNNSRQANEKRMHFNFESNLNEANPSITRKVIQPTEDCF
jgi:hypothetical protein